MQPSSASTTPAAVPEHASHAPASALCNPYTQPANKMTQLISSCAFISQVKPRMPHVAFSKSSTNTLPTDILYQGWLAFDAAC